MVKDTLDRWQPQEFCKGGSTIAVGCLSPACLGVLAGLAMLAHVAACSWGCARMRRGDRRAGQSPNLGQNVITPSKGH